MSSEDSRKVSEIKSILDAFVFEYILKTTLGFFFFTFLCCSITKSHHNITRCYLLSTLEWPSTDLCSGKWHLCCSVVVSVLFCLTPSGFHSKVSCDFAERQECSQGHSGSAEQWHICYSTFPFTPHYLPGNYMWFFLFVPPKEQFLHHSHKFLHTNNELLSLPWAVLHFSQQQSKQLDWVCWFIKAQIFQRESQHEKVPLKLRIH